MAVSATRVCARCATHDSEVAYCAAVDAWVCLGCYLTSTPPEPRGRAGACPRCGEPRGGRYEGLCWTCWAKDHPEPTRKRPAPEPMTRFVDRLWTAIDLTTGHPPAYMGRWRLASYCPACLDGSLSIRLLHHPSPGASFRCSRGCTEPQIADALRSS